MLHVERSGTGRDLVLLHGWGLHGRVWAPLAGHVQPSHRLHVVDLPGHGLSRDVPFGDLDALADRLSECLPGGAIVCGWSLGALLALRLATRHERLVAALVLVGATPCFVEREDWPHAMKLSTLESFAQGLRTDPARTIRSFIALNAHGGPESRPRTRELAALLAEREAPSAPTLAAGLSLLRETDLRADVAGIACPATVIHGSRDALAPVEAGRWLACALPAARLVEIPEAAHFPFASHAGQVAEAIGATHG